MSLTAAVIRELISAGLAGEALADACQRIEDASNCEVSRGSSAIRQQRYRDRNALRNVTLSVTQESFPEASPHTPLTKPFKESSKNPPKGGQKGSKPKQDFETLELTPALEAVAAENGRDPGSELEKFKDYCRAKAPKYKDYVAAFRNWLKSDFGRSAPPSTAPPWESAKQREARESDEAMKAWEQELAQADELRKKADEATSKPGGLPKSTPGRAGPDEGDLRRPGA